MAKIWTPPPTQPPARQLTPWELDATQHYTPPRRADIMGGLLELETAFDILNGDIQLPESMDRSETARQFFKRGEYMLIRKKPLPDHIVNSDKWLKYFIVDILKSYEEYLNKGTSKYSNGHLIKIRQIAQKYKQKTVDIY